MIFTKTKIAGCYIIDLELHEDNRGVFARLFCEDEFRSQGLDPSIAQINTAQSLYAGTLRGMHYQTAPHSDTKLVKCLRGAIFDVCLDLRPDSPTFCEWVSVELSDENRRMLFLPAGTAHGYQTISDATEIMYTTNQDYAPQSATGVRYNDKRFKIRWPGEVTSISEADRSWPDYKY